MSSKFLAALLLPTIIMGGCHHKIPDPIVVTKVQIVEAKIPVPVKVKAPDDLMAPLTSPLPVFIAPTDPLASSALSAEGERTLRGLVEDLLGRLAAWKAWTSTPLDPPASN